MEDEPIDPIQRNTDIDKLTLELFMNKGLYNKYIQKTDPKAHEEKQNYISQLRKYKNNIIDITETLLNDPDTLITTDVNNGFNDYAKVLIKYFDMKSMGGMRPKKYGAEDDNNNDNNDDDDVLFSNMDNMPLPTTSFWSKERIRKL